MSPNIDGGQRHTPRFAVRYWPQLDGLRGLAIVIVMLFHGNVVAVHGGFVGVDVFFVLSGFLVTAILLAELDRTGGISLRRFFLRRFVRLVPALVILLGASYLWASLQPGHPFAAGTKAAVPLAAANVSNWATALGPYPLGILAHTWSLGVEWQFYLLWPLVLLAVRRLRLPPVSLALLVLSLVTVVAGWRAMQWGPDVAGSARAFAGFDTRADAPLLGALVAIVLWAGFRPRTALQRRAVQGAGLVGSVVLALAFRQATHFAPNLYRRGGYIVIAVAAAAVVLSLVTIPPPLIGRALRWRPLVGLGRISYGLYLWHFPVMQVVGPSQPGALRPGGVLALDLALSLGLALLSYRYVERPLLARMTRSAVPSASRPGLVIRFPAGTAGPVPAQP